VCSSSPAGSPARLRSKHRDPSDRRVFVLVERFRDRAAHDEHVAAAHTRRHAIEDALPRLETREREVLEPMAGISDRHGALGEGMVD
jgi:hypothetical protein